MPIPKYGVLIGRAVDRRFATASSNHYELKLMAGGQPYRIAVNTQSQDHSEVLYAVKRPFDHALLPYLANLGDGYHPIASQPGGLAIDFVKGAGFVTRQEMAPLPSTLPGNDNDLNDKLDALVQRAFDEDGARVFAFGSFFRNPGLEDHIFRFRPAQGIHDVHMNQGNAQRWLEDDGVWQDGALLFRFADGSWTAVFTAFQNQSWQTDAQGHAIRDTPQPEPMPEPMPIPVPAAPLLRIVAAVANSIGAPDVETVTLINPSPDPIDVAGWVLRDRNRHDFALDGTIEPGSTRKITIARPMELSNKGGSITLVDNGGMVVDMVSYSREDASRPGWTIVFRE